MLGKGKHLLQHFMNSQYYRGRFVTALSDLVPSLLMHTQLTSIKTFLMESREKNIKFGKPLQL